MTAESEIHEVYGIVVWNSESNMTGLEVLIDYDDQLFISDIHNLPPGCLIPDNIDGTEAKLIIEGDFENEATPQEVIGLNTKHCSDCKLIELCDPKRVFDYFSEEIPTNFDELERRSMLRRKILLMQLFGKVTIPSSN